MAARKPQSPFDDIAKLLAKQGLKLTKKEVLDIKRYARGVGRTDYLDRKPNKVFKPKTAAQKRNAFGIENIEYRRDDKRARLYGDSNGPIDYFFSSKNPNRGQKKMINQAFSAEGKIAANNARKVQKALAKPVKKAAPKKAAAKKAPVKKTAAKKK